MTVDEKPLPQRERLVRLGDVLDALRQYDRDVEALGWDAAVGEHPADTVLRCVGTRAWTAPMPSATYDKETP